MKRVFLHVSITAFVFIVVCSPVSMAQNRSNAISIRGGIYQGTDDLDEGDTGINVAVSYNRYFSPKFAMEFGLGYFDTEATESGFDPFFLGSFTEKDQVSAIPLTVNAKGIIPFEWGEFYAGGGLGVYLVDFDANVVSSFQGSATLSDSDTIFGAQILAGLLFNITEVIYLGIDGQIIITDDAQASGTVFGIPIVLEGNLTGYTVSGVIGFRF